MSRLHHCPPTVPCPVCNARALETLLESGRAHMALHLARGLDDAIIEALGQAMLRGRAQALNPLVAGGRSRAERARGVEVPS